MPELINTLDVDTQLQKEPPHAILQYALNNFDNIAISFSGAEDVALIDMAYQIRSDIQVFSLDTGRLHPETYRFIEKVRKHYGLKIDVLMPDAAAVADLVREKGLFSFYDGDHKECCSIRKVMPLRNKLLTLDAWITGQRKDQSPGTRTAIPVIQDDLAFSRPNEKLVKFNPLANWSSRMVWDYIRGNQVPYNELHDKGFVSIGCEPCTKSLGPNQHEREGRWWWEAETQKECGLHATNLEDK
ncbi:phosphoadenylyl-sulfate reductase [Aurantivibrio plasticivorans]